MADPRETVARWGHVHSYLFPWMREEFDPCSEALPRLIIVLDTIGLEAFVPPPPGGGRGRKPDDRRVVARAFVAKAVLSLPTTTALVERLAIDKSLRRICDWETRREVPSEATFSRAFREFAATELPERMHEALVKRTLGDRWVGCVVRDATEIEARESRREGRSTAAAQCRSAAQARAPEERRGTAEGTHPSARQMSQSTKEMLAELPTDCDVGTKNNSKGYKQSWTGYKLHIDVVDGQIPVCCLLTSASVHDMASAWCSAFKSALAWKLRVDHGNMAEGPAVFDDLRGIIGRVHDVVQISDPLPGDGHERDGDLARWNLVRLEGNI